MNDKDKLERYQRLKISAASCCTQIFDEFTQEQVMCQPLAVQNAWEVGRKIDEMEDY